jgi:hypothetical protein
MSYDYEVRLEDENERLKAALNALLRRIQETDNPSDQGISQSDACVADAISLLKELEPTAPPAPPAP